MTDQATNPSLFPMQMGGTPDAPIPPDIFAFMNALNNLNDRLTAIENRPVNLDGPVTDPSAPVFSAADRAMLDEVGGFLGVHRVVANTVATRASDPAADIDPTTGLPRAAVVRAQPAPPNTGGFQNFQTSPLSGA